MERWEYRELTWCKGKVGRSLTGRGPRGHNHTKWHSDKLQGTVWAYKSWVSVEFICRYLFVVHFSCTERHPCLLKVSHDGGEGSRPLLPLKGSSRGVPRVERRPAAPLFRCLRHTEGSGDREGGLPPSPRGSIPPEGQPKANANRSDARRARGPSMNSSRQRGQPGSHRQDRGKGAHQGLGRLAGPLGGIRRLRRRTAQGDRGTAGDGPEMPTELQLLRQSFRGGRNALFSRNLIRSATTLRAHYQCTGRVGQFNKFGGKR